VAEAEDSYWLHRDYHLSHFCINPTCTDQIANARERLARL
jgi:hypothetical protein